MTTNVSIGKMANVKTSLSELRNVDVSTSLTPEALIAYCESKLRGIDDQVNQGLANQKLRNSQTEALGELATSIGAYKNGADASDPDARAALEGAFNTAMGHFPQGSDAYNQLDKQKAAVLTDFDKGGINGADIPGYVSNITNLQSSMNHDGEIEMLQLQSLVSQRQTALQTCTNMIGSINDSAKAIASKIGG